MFDPVKLPNVPSGRRGQSERQKAAGLLRSYNNAIRRWQREAEDLPNYGAYNVNPVDLSQWLSFTSEDMEAFESLADVQDAIDARLELIDERVEAQRDRYKTRERVTSHRKRGRPRELKYGQFVYFATAYNHGAGAGLYGYVAEEASIYDPTHIDEWV